MSEFNAAPQFRPRPLLHLLWTVPIALAVTWLAGVWMTINWCGISGCSGGGFGRISDPSLGGVLVGSALIAFVWFAIVAIIPWHTSRRMRLILAVVAGLLMSTAMTLIGTSAFVR
ncbi:hypothetical protein BW730_13270 [Tessaracoccus aquimaris]|uniref:Transmembrane protein n=1 Tax=Tessaracoccus aquimaris TaxID=1332264 RepID=A0A1Q2CQD7_9ACTN|nr:hypothetical protein [Tessaracoccus aquimaris]AQP48327.1 hypothetical protein BW730_13270 [Tessaracoccus aquimaris]